MVNGDKLGIRRYTCISKIDLCLNYMDKTSFKFPPFSKDMKAS